MRRLSERDHSSPEGQQSGEFRQGRRHQTDGRITEADVAPTQALLQQRPRALPQQAITSPFPARALGGCLRSGNRHLSQYMGLGNVAYPNAVVTNEIQTKIEVFGNAVAPPGLLQYLPGKGHPISFEAHRQPEPFITQRPYMIVEIECARHQSGPPPFLLIQYAVAALERATTVSILPRHQAFRHNTQKIRSDPGVGVDNNKRFGAYRAAQQFGESPVERIAFSPLLLMEAFQHGDAMLSGDRGGGIGAVIGNYDRFKSVCGVVL